jgi:hypothetical protein
MFMKTGGGAMSCTPLAAASPRLSTEARVILPS